MTKQLTNTQAYTMIDTGKAVRHGDTLVTRTAFYQWRDEENAYVQTHTGLRVQHTSGTNVHNKRGFQWSSKDKRFYACACSHCF